MDVQALRERLYAALKHEKSCACGECSGGLNAVDALVARVAELEHVIECADTPLMRDVLSERDAALGRVAELEQQLAAAGGDRR